MLLAWFWYVVVSLCLISLKEFGNDDDKVEMLVGFTTSDPHRPLLFHY